MLYSHITSSPVVADFPALARRIANNELPHGADIIVGIHTRLLKEPHPLPWRRAVAPLAKFSGPPEPVQIVASASDPPDADAETGPPDAEKPGICLMSFGSGASVPCAPPQLSGTVAPPTISSITKPTMAVKKGFGGMKSSATNKPSSSPSSLSPPALPRWNRPKDDEETAPQGTGRVSSPLAFKFGGVGESIDNLPRVTLFLIAAHFRRNQPKAEELLLMFQLFCKPGVSLSEHSNDR